MNYGEIILSTAAETAPTEDEIVELVSIAEMKAELSIRHSLLDDRIEAAIFDAYSWLDGPNGWLNRAILTQTWKAFAPRFDCTIELPIPPLQSITSVRHRDTDGNWQATSATLWGSNLAGTYGSVFLKSQQDWPSVYPEMNPVEIVFVAGYGDAAAVKSKARGITRAIKLLAAHWYENPSATFSDVRLIEVPRTLELGLKAAAGKYRLWLDHS